MRCIAVPRVGVRRLSKEGATTIKGGRDDYRQGVRRITVLKSDKPPQIGSRRSRPDTTYIQNTQPGWSRRSAGDAPTERTSRASPSSASLGVRRISVPRGKRDHCLYLLPYRRWRVICASNLAQGRAAARVPDKPRQALSRGAPNVHL
jgi:hypothetical protein